MNIEDVQNKLEWLTSRWWFYVIFLALQLMPPYAAKGLGEGGLPKFLAGHLAGAFMHDIPAWNPVFKVLPIILIICIIIFGNKIGRFFSLYAGLSYIAFNLLQNFSVTDAYGLGILTSNLVSMLLVSLGWFWEAFAGKNDFSAVKLNFWKWIAILLAFLAFWCPIDPATHAPSFTLASLFTNDGGVAFCMMTPVYLAVLLIFYPKINRALLRVISTAGIIIGIFNVLVVLANPSVYWWFGVLHIPLFALSVCGLWLGLRTNRTREAI